MSKEQRRMRLAVGTVWEGDLEVRVEVKPPAPRDDPRSRLALRLAWPAGISMAVFAAYGMYRGDGQLLDRVWRLVEYLVIFLAGWISGHPRGPLKL